ncbi:Mitochondrial FAD-linked sulfhydryl oxidase ERV1 [Vanrija pseudolonga]|uniref:Sulfhydryl oxidase n=1 Tax=Vanrija pseudolonga TaxID=143232 RepID=A0AAF0Y005_9TREE|nr:Mitochondrial FAD-linked sulfhydryl oxidase ERV1 [Vanrija pseudolonga]
MAAPSTAAGTEPKRTTKETHPHLPPGLILDENGKVCKVCNTWQDFGKMKVKKKAAAGAAPAATAATGAGATTVAAAAVGSSSTRTPDRTNCPPDTAELGRATWAFLHTTAAYYPTNPSATQQNHMRSLLQSLPALYPCGWCADDFGRAIAAAPPVVSSRESLSRWLCERHNEVNVKLGKKAFSCEEIR